MTKLILISTNEQKMYCYNGTKIVKCYTVSTAKNGLGEITDSNCTPRGWHYIYSHIGMDLPINSVFVGRKWTKEIYTDNLARQYPKRDWILTRILQIAGLEAGRNQGGNLDSLKRNIYIHGTPYVEYLGMPCSHGCIRLGSLDVIELVHWADIGTHLCIA